MTVRTRGIRLKDRLSPEDQGQRKLMQVTYSQLAALGQAASGDPPDNTLSPPLLSPQGRSKPSDARRRAIARMLRVELEATLLLLDRALQDYVAAETDETT